MTSEHLPSVPYPGLLKSWLAFTRPKTWLIAISPVLATLALCYLEGHAIQWIVALLTLTISVLMQVISNMQNDLGYTEKKAERSNRKGLPRATSLGWISCKSAKIAIRLTIVLALLNSCALVYFGGYIFLVLGILSLLAAYFYMGGPKPIAYSPFGELTVLIFFGLTAVCGTYYLQTHEVNLSAILLSFALGAIASSVLLVNNYRDIIHDASIGRQTLAVVFGKDLCEKLFAFLLFCPYLLAIALTFRNISSYWPLLIVFASYPATRKLPEQLKTRKNEELNAVMFACVQYEMKFSFLFILGCLLVVAIRYFI